MIDMKHYDNAIVDCLHNLNWGAILDPTNWGPGLLAWAVGSSTMDIVKDLTIIFSLLVSGFKILDQLAVWYFRYRDWKKQNKK